jgi:patatin-like phospholipase domain-containing protein 2
VTSLALGGAFFAWPYLAGVASFVQRERALAPHARVYGTSSGAVVATMLACGIDVAQDGMDLGMRADRDGLGGRRTPFFRPTAFLAPHIDEMDRALPADAHARAHGRLFITIRRAPRFRQVAISDFPTREALLDVLAAAVAVPGLTVPLVHRSPRYGVCLDGGPGVPVDDRPGVPTTRVGVFQRGDYHLRPSTPVGFDLLFGVPAESRRRELFSLGYADAGRHFGGTP